MPTYHVSPVYEGMREPQPMPIPPTSDLSPYPMTRDYSPKAMRKPYQVPAYVNKEPFHEIPEPHSRFDEATLRRDRYQEPLDNRDRYMQREQEQDQYPVEQHARGRQMGGREHHQRDQYHDMRPEQQTSGADGPAYMYEPKPEFCNKCFKSNACMNKLGCAHQYCDECMSRLSGSDNPFRDTIRWHYCCDLCKKWTSESKVQRIAPDGKRLTLRTSSR